MMAINSVLQYFHTGALSEALKGALVGIVDAVSTFGVSRPIKLLKDGQDAVLNPAQELIAQGVFDAHDPVFITCPVSAVYADGATTATITVNAPKPGADSITLVCTKPDGSTLTKAVSMVGGVGSVPFKTSVGGTYTITLQNPSNRTTDQVVIIGL